MQDFPHFLDPVEHLAFALFEIFGDFVHSLEHLREHLDRAFSVL